MISDLNITIVMDEATEIMSLIDEIASEQNPEIKFEHVLCWWIASEPAEA
tara:strand:+ start:89 stop:238 length:150 start_codon:yes stop_codon:yes gene_type:complete